MHDTCCPVVGDESGPLRKVATIGSFLILPDVHLQTIMCVLSAEAQHVLFLPGKQAEVLNILVEDVMQGHPVSEQRLKEVLGHNPLEVGLCTLWCLFAARDVQRECP